MNQLQVTARLKIHEGKLDEFKQLAAQCLMTVKEMDQDTLQYDWFFNKEQTECVVRERYTDSNAIFAHLANLGELFGKILAVSDFSVEVFGEPSQELINATKNLNPKIYSFYQGL